MEMSKQDQFPLKFRKNAGTHMRYESLARYVLNAYELKKAPLLKNRGPGRSISEQGGRRWGGIRFG